MKKSPKVKISPKKTAVIIVVVLLIVASIAGFYFFNQYQKKQALLKNPTIAKEIDTKNIVEKVGKLIKLPNETPSVATVSDISKLKNQTLFQNAQNGDKVLIFNKAKRAIVYRPSDNQIIEIGNVVVSPESSASSQVSPSVQKTKIVLYNGTKTAGYAKKVGVDVVGKIENSEVTGTANASGEYTKNTVYVISDNPSFAKTAKAIAALIDGEVVSKLPIGEEKPTNADILIILGQ